MIAIVVIFNKSKFMLKMYVFHLDVLYLIVALFNFDLKWKVRNFN